MEETASTRFSQAKSATKNDFVVVQKLYEEAENAELKSGMKLLLQLYTDKEATIDARAFAAKIVAKESMDLFPNVLQADKDIPKDIAMGLLNMLDFARKNLDNDADVHFNFALLALAFSESFGETEEVIIYNAYISLLISEQHSGIEEQEIFSICFRKLYECTREKKYDKIHALFNEYALSPLVHKKMINEMQENPPKIFDQAAKHLNENLMTIAAIKEAAFKNLPSFCQYLMCFRSLHIVTK